MVAGDYPYTEHGQHIYPRRHMFEQACGVLAEAGASVPIFNDKHLSYAFEDAQWMVDRAAELNCPLGSGSSLPFAWRKPYLEHPIGVVLTEAIVVGYSDLDSFGPHALEALGCMVERRQGGEAGVRSVQYLEGSAVWEAERAGRWSRDLAEAAVSCVGGGADGHTVGLVGSGGYGSEDKADPTIQAMDELCDNPMAIVVEYEDGLRATVLLLNGYVTQMSYAARQASGEVGACEFFLAGGPDPGDEWVEPDTGSCWTGFSYFSYLLLNVRSTMLGKQMLVVQKHLLLS